MNSRDDDDVYPRGGEEELDAPLNNNCDFMRWLHRMDQRML